VFWGDTHNHTSVSFDVYLFGTPNATPDIAYRFAKGERVINPSTGTPWQLSRPLDFLVVADHAELLGAMPRLFVGEDPDLAGTKTGRAMLEMAPDRTEEQLQEVYDAINYVASNQPNALGVTPEELLRDLHAGDKRTGAWEGQIEAAERHNEPGVFTALIGFEWSSNTNGANLHRVVFQAEGGEVARQYIPYSYLESDDPEDLWSWLDTTGERTGATFVAIPHNPNISLGMFFPLIRHNGERVDEAYAKERMRWEPVVETTQIKGDSESHPALSPNDGFADCEVYDFALTPDGTRPEPTEADYVRSGLKRGLKLGAELGANPYKVGMIGSTDSHTGIAAVEEDNFAGKGQHDNNPEKRSHPTGLGSSKGWDMAAAGYARGVPMGGDLELAPGEAPTFLAAVMKDPEGANLDRVQIIKGWVDADGRSHEWIYDVAVSGGRTIRDDGRCREPVGNTVDLGTGRYTNTIGAAELSVAWTDPDFDPQQPAFYYVRALEIPTPRYSLLDALALGIDWTETNRPPTIQERVYSSPIWYTP